MVLLSAVWIRSVLNKRTDTSNYDYTQTEDKNLIKKGGKTFGIQEGEREREGGQVGKR